MMKIDLSTMADAVHDEPSFLAFLEALRADWLDEQRKEKEQPSSPYGPGANGWENHTIGDFLDAAHSWGEASAEGLRYYKVPDNPWCRMAQILWMGKIYE
ncbi:DUF7660 family protein [Massilia rubra]|nr:hypothetical protein [Massilia rubra]